MAYPRSQRARAHKFVKRTAGNISITSAGFSNWTTVDTAMNLTLDAQVGDVIECYVNGLLDNAVTELRFDVATMNGTTVLNYFGTAVQPNTGEGITGWVASSNPTYYQGLALPIPKVLVASDIVNETVTLALRVRHVAGATRVLFGSATNPLFFVAKNHGPPDPN